MARVRLNFKRLATTFPGLINEFDPANKFPSSCRCSRTTTRTSWQFVDETYETEFLCRRKKSYLVRIFNHWSCLNNSWLNYLCRLKKKLEKKGKKIFRYDFQNKLDTNNSRIAEESGLAAIIVPLFQYLNQFKAYYSDMHIIFINLWLVNILKKIF